ncbi:hypothetical protein CHS0354_018965 [Potamilus streckersoni]|uniref:DIS3-like exonuclease 1 n=1 Tax=Potamilus streckersoni TaxID=2493646 RepID=A0AAE0W921_9BIVA|nr:hypothetical protein CHS0354_018965 [Potamilus streckersoni]
MTDILQKSNRFLRFKSSKGGGVCVVREIYRRETVPCQSSLCLNNCQESTEELHLLPREVTHYLMPDPAVARDYLEILEESSFTGIIFTQTTVHSVQHEGSRKLLSRLKNIVKDKRRRSIIFHNEFQTYAYCEREQGEILAVWQRRATFQCAEWFYNHLAGQMPIVMLTDDQQTCEEYGKKTVNVFVLTVEDYLNRFWKDISPGLMELYYSLKASVGRKSKGKEYSGYLPQDMLTAGLKSGKLIQGFLQVNRNNAFTEAFVRTSRQDMTEESSSDIFIYSSAARNRAVHGDLVVVEILPKSHWRGRSLIIKDEEGEGEDAAARKDDREDTTPALPTGQVVGIVQRNWKEYVATFAQDEETGSGDKKAGKVLVIPYDYRIPKIRISTRQMNALIDHRIVVRIDSWEIDSQYPNGHVVRSLGKRGDLETEIAAILIENSISVNQFSDAQMKEMPADTPERPWRMDESEVNKRRDLRDTHLVFSIDPKGCEDVDDTLSVRLLETGNIELGVHIADVSYYVRPDSLTDIEARERSTTVYLADRRYDMLPAILSANLCSLVSGVDRYAVSVIWELSPNYDVLDVWYGRTVIKSRYKLFYELAQAISEGLSSEEVVRNIPELQGITGQELVERIQELRTAIGYLMAISRHLKARRVRGGALELESVEVQVQLSETKSIEDLTPKEHLEIHDTVADCMIFANHWVAKKITESLPNQALLRHHPPPREEQFSNLKNCAATHGFDIKTKSNKDLAESLDKCVDPQDPVVNKLLRMLATQAMTNAEYFSTGSLSRDQFFHYGLALDLYTHFTSPIRRYADILVHRQLLSAVGEDNVKLPSNTELDDMSKHINQKHRAAQYAQRESQELFQCLFFKGRGGSDDDEHCIVDAIIYQIRANGLFVYVPRYGIKGPVYLRSKEGQVLYLQTNGSPEWTGGEISRTDQYITVTCLYGQKTYRLLDHITVKLTLLESWAHSSGLKLQLMSNSPHKSSQQEVKNLAKQQKAEIIKEVSSAAEDKRCMQMSHDLGPNFSELKKQYGQTPEEQSLYSLFESFRETALFSAR